jgi:hypothetical protein
MNFLASQASSLSQTRRAGRWNCEKSKYDKKAEISYQLTFLFHPHFDVQHEITAAYDTAEGKSDAKNCKNKRRKA